MSVRGGGHNPNRKQTHRDVPWYQINEKINKNEELKRFMVKLNAITDPSTTTQQNKTKKKSPNLEKMIRKNNFLLPRKRVMQKKGDTGGWTYERKSKKI